MMNNIPSWAFVAIFVLLSTGCTGIGSDISSGTTCADFDTQPEAQANYHEDLDSDHDGIACEHLPDDVLAESKVTADVSSAIGEYTLLGQNCESEYCSVQAASLRILSENTFVLCIYSDMEKVCYPEDELTFTLSKTEDHLHHFNQGVIELGHFGTGHVKLTYQDTTFYGQDILMTDASKAGFYHTNGVIQSPDGSLTLTSYSGQVVHWDKTNHLSVTP